VQEHLQFMADMHGLDAGIARERILRAIDECSIGEVLTRPIGHLSKGYRQRVGLAGAILHEPEILILDEPTTGLDPNQIVEIRDLVRQMGKTKTIILSTHILPEVEATCGRAIIILDGLIRADGNLDELTRSRMQVVSVAAPDAETALGLLGSLPNVAAAHLDSEEGTFQTYRLEIEGENEIGEIVSQAVRERGWALRELKRDDKTLEQVFRELTESQKGAPV